MWGWIVDAASAAWDAVKGFFSDLWQFVKWLIHRGIGLIEFILTMLGVMLPKKIRVQAVVLLDEHRKPTASREDVQRAVDLADAVFRDEVNVRVVSPVGHVTIEPDPAPSFVLDVECGSSAFFSQFTAVGAWLRAHANRTPWGTILGNGAPVTAYVVRDVRNKSGCSVAFIADYIVIDPAALAGQEGMRLTLAHEIGHACDLWHDSGTLMQAGPTGRPRKLSRYQRAIFRSSPHVTYT
jgi:hypothetical protein